MKKTISIVCVVTLIVGIGLVEAADVFDMPTGLTSLKTVTVGNPNNAGEWSGSSGDSYTSAERICGAVSYEYNIGKYEVTAAQYTEFLNAVATTDPYGLYNSDMWSSSHGCKILRLGSSGSYTYSVGLSAYANHPVNYVSWGDAARFANWLTNGQGNGSTETGAYNLGVATTNEALMAVAVPTAVQRETWSNGVKPYFLLTSEDEWYKAAYYTTDLDKNGTHDDPGYYDYPTSSDTIPGYVNNSGNLSGTGDPFTEDGTDPGNYATYDGDGVIDGIGSPYWCTEVAEWENSDSPYGTFDQGGNVWEWNEAIIKAGKYRGLRGGSFTGVDFALHASFRPAQTATMEDYTLGFRVSEVPEPATLTLLTLGGLAILRRRRGGR